MSSSGSYDYALALRTFKKLVLAVPEDGELFQTHAHSIFFDIRSWTKNNKIGDLSLRHSLVGFIKIFIVLIFQLLVTFISLAYLFFKRPHIAVFTGDRLGNSQKNDPRLTPIYKALARDNRPYFEVVHAVPGMQMITNFFRRLRPVVYLELLDVLSSLSVHSEKIRIENSLATRNFSALTSGESKLLKFILVKYGSLMVMSNLRKQYLSIVFKFLSPKLVFMIDDVRHWHEVISASKLNNIPTYAVQHGHFTKYHLGWIKVAEVDVVKPDHMLVWSDYWKDELINIGTYFKPAEIKIVGYYGSAQFSTRKVDRLTTVLIPYEAEAPKKEVKQYIEKIGAMFQTEVIFKARNDIPVDGQLEEYGFKSTPSYMKVLTDVEEFIDIIDVAIGTYSTYLYEMVLRGIPVGIIKTSLDYGEGMVANGLADLVSQGKDMEANIRSITSTSETVLKSRKDKLMGGNNARLVDALEVIIKQYT